MKSTKLLHHVLEHMPRILSNLDRRPSSSTYGCFDREYWLYKTVDFACARKQEAVLTLALLYTFNHKQNPYYQSQQIREWIDAALHFWITIQENNGSFNEWYPHEDSFVATAFSTVAISETAIELNVKSPKLNSAIAKAASFLCNTQETRVFNQQSGAALALYNAYVLTNNEKFKRQAKKKIEIIKKAQTREGWWYEYEGPDVGYLSLMIDYLSKYHQKDGDHSLLPVLKKATHFLSHFIHPDATIGGTYASRNTTYLIPSGLYYLSQIIEEAKGPVHCIEENLSYRSGTLLHALDDRYLLYNAYTYLQAQKVDHPRSSKLHMKEDTFFPHANMLIKNTKHHYLILNISKSSFSLWAKKTGKKIEDSGVLLRSKTEIYTSGRLQQTQATQNPLKIRTKFHRVKPQRMTPIKYVMLHSFQETLGRIRVFNKVLKKILRDVLISKKSKGLGSLERRITITDKVTITDDIHPPKERMQALIGYRYSELYIPSAEYFQLQELQNEGHKVGLTGHTTITRTIEKDGSMRIS